ncbi:hypothetical protein H2201_003681 [Coniosporium apollinis]|uniref:Uncharacterized protein n=1 Tax=Coniosporium apollinis TaxID=61459 RepID=A0ABQ9P1H7_9PEZI|nr:hypothetical protein H2201_003681 [Coniosporium apollinis]
MLNFSRSHSQDTLLLNDCQILPLRGPPPFIDAYQTPANVTVDETSLMISVHQLNYRLGKAEGPWASYGLSYDHSVRPAANPNNVILEFDVIGWSQAAVDDPAQQMVSIEIGSNATVMIIGEVNLVPRPPPYRGEPTNEYPFWCPDFLEPTVDYLLSRPRHPDPPGHTIFRRYEWDGFGRKGTLSHGWAALCGWFGWAVMLTVVAVVVPCLTLCYGLYRLVLHIRKSGDKEYGSEEREQLMGDEEDADETFDEKKVIDEEASLPSLPTGKY